MQALNVTGVAISGLFIFFIINKKNRLRADYLLLLINVLMIAFLVLDLVVRQQLTVGLFFFQTIAPYLLFPTFIFFALELLQETIHQKAKWVLLFLPAIISTVFFAFDLFVFNRPQSNELLELYNNPPLFYHLFYKGNQLLFLMALIWLIRRLGSYSRKIRNVYSFIDPIQLQWLKNSSILYLIIMIVSLSIFLLSNLHILSIDVNAAYSIVSLCVVVAAFYISFHGIRQYSIADYYGKNKTKPVGSETRVESAEPEKYKTSSLSDEEQEKIYQNLIQFFELQQLYLEPKLQLPEVAERLAVTTHSLSQTINSVTGKSFYDLVNGYRVRHLQKLLADSTKKKFTILALGLDSGFNSKASLNRVFKEETGLSPKEFQVQHLAK
jgi:AraC-like DNA-binding protein